MYKIHFDTNNQQAFFDECHQTLLNNINSALSSTSSATNPTLFNFLNYYRDKDALKCLMCASFNEQVDIIIKWYTNLNDENGSIKKLLDIFVEGCYKKTELNKSGNWKQHLIDNLKLDVCPYCGRSYITSIRKNHNKHVLKPQIDHYFPKHKYPFLAMTYRNLIPCCNVCNMSGAKGTNDPIDFTTADHSTRSGYKEFLMNPYEYSEDELNFDFELLDINLLRPESYNVIFNAPNYEKGYKEWLALDLLYKQHSDLVRDDVVKSFLLYTALPRLYNASFSISGSGLKLLTQCIMGFEYDHSKDSNRIMSKFHREIFSKIMDLIQKGKRRRQIRRSAVDRKFGRDK